MVEAGPACPVERPGRACLPRLLAGVRVEARALAPGAAAAVAASIR